MSRIMNHDDVVIDIEAMLERAEAPITEECCIYRVPLYIRKVNEDAYTPRVVSIGPFHHNSHPRLQNMERHKLIYCNAFLARTQATADSWIRYIEDVEPNFRRCYSETLEFSKEELVKIIFVDSGFILEFLWRRYYGEWPEDDLVLLQPWLMVSINLDLSLLENQLPFFVLDDLFDLSFTSTSGTGGNNNNPSFFELTFRYFSTYYNKSNLNFHNMSIWHFTDLMRTFYLQHPPERRPCWTGDVVKTVPTVTELSEAGLKFKINTSECLLHLDFSEGVLEIPQLEVEDNWTERTFRNIVALEQCHYPYEAYVTEYVYLLDFLVNTSRDVDILVQNGVLVNWLGDTDSVARLFNSLSKNITHGKFNSHYSRLCQDLNAFYRNRWHNLKSTLRRDYCKGPWQTAASIAAIVLLILSLLQTVCSVLQVIQK